VATIRRQANRKWLSDKAVRRARFGAQLIDVRSQQFGRSNPLNADICANSAPSRKAHRKVLRRGSFTVGAVVFGYPSPGHHSREQQRSAAQFDQGQGCHAVCCRPSWLLQQAPLCGLPENCWSQIFPSPMHGEEFLP